MTSFTLLKNNNSHKLFAGLIALVLVAGMTSPAFADPTGDVVEITVNHPTEPATPLPVIVVPGPEEFFVNINDMTEFVVDVEDGIVVVDFPFGHGGPIGPYEITISDIDWLDESQQEVPGEIVNLTCEVRLEENSVETYFPIDYGAQNGPDGSEIGMIFDPEGGFPPGIPFAIQCNYTVEHSEPERECEISPNSANVEVVEVDGSGFVDKKITCNFPVAGFLDDPVHDCDPYEIYTGPVDPSDTELMFTERVTSFESIEPQHCLATFEVIFADGLNIFVEQELWINMNQPIGGTVGSMSTTSLLVAGAQANMGLWSLALVGIVGAAAAITYKVKSKSEQ